MVRLILTGVLHYFVSSFVIRLFRYQIMIPNVQRQDDFTFEDPLYHIQRQGCLGMHCTRNALRLSRCESLAFLFLQTDRAFDELTCDEH
jgi:hypothetical protein